MKISFIGVGIMGRGILKNLKKTNSTLQLYARNQNKIEDLKDERTYIFSDIKEAVKDTDITILCLTEDEIVYDAFYNKGILEYSNHLILDFGTTSPKLTRLMQENSKSKNVKFFDCPMTGSKLAAENGEIVFMLGGTKSDSENFQFILDVCGKKTIYCNEVGKGQEMKIVLNMIQAGLMQIYMEGMILSKKLNLDTEIIKEIISNSAAKSGISEFKLNSISKKDYSPNFSLKNMNKDLNHALNLANETKSSLVLSSSLKSIYNSGITNGFSEEDFSSLYKINEILNDIKN